MAIKEKNSKGFKKASFFLENLTKKNFEKRGFSQRKILTNWTEVVGVSLAERTNPIKISFPKNSLGGTLVLEVQGSFGPEVQMQSEIIKEKVNKVYGYTAIYRVIIKQSLRKLFDSSTLHHMYQDEAIEDDVLELDEINKIYDTELRNQLKELGSLLKNKYRKAILKKQKG